MEKVKLEKVLLTGTELKDKIYELVKKTPPGCQITGRTIPYLHHNVQRQLEFEIKVAVDPEEVKTTIDHLVAEKKVNIKPATDPNRNTYFVLATSAS